METEEGYYSDNKQPDSRQYTTGPMGDPPLHGGGGGGGGGVGPGLTTGQVPQQAPEGHHHNMAMYRSCSHESAVEREYYKMGGPNTDTMEPQDLKYNVDACSPRLHHPHHHLPPPPPPPHHHHHHPQGGPPPHGSDRDQHGNHGNPTAGSGGVFGGYHGSMPGTCSWPPPTTSQYTALPHGVVCKQEDE